MKALSKENKIKYGECICEKIETEHKMNFQRWIKLTPSFTVALQELHCLKITLMFPCYISLSFPT